MKPSVLTRSVDNFDAWKVQATAYLDLDTPIDGEADSAATIRKVNKLLLAVDVSLLRDIKVDNRTTVSSLFEKIHKNWARERRPPNPFEAFTAIRCGSNLRDCLNRLRDAGRYFNASDDVIRQRFLEILPSPIKTSAYLEVAREPKLSSEALVNLLEYVPIDVSVVATSSTPKKELICYFCGEAGHSRNRCPMIKCYNCQNFGHVKRNCPKTASSSKN